MRRFFFAAAIAPLLALGVTWTANAADQTPACNTASVPRNVQRYRTAQGEEGYIGRPRGKPKALVVFFHGYGHDAVDWARCHLGQVAEAEGVETVAMSYPGWQVQEGATASLHAVAELRKKGELVVAYGVSMGGNASGLAVIDKPGLVDYWIDVEGATNVIETYLEARALAPANSFAAGAVKDIEAEMGNKPIEQNPEGYRAHDVVARASEVQVNKGVVMCHGVGDGLVPYDQSREMAGALRGLGIKVDFTTVGLRTPGSDEGTTIDGYADPAVPHESPFAGHANEDSTNHDVGNCGFTRLHEVLTNRFAGDREVVATAL